jgi:8-oxo-dGTP diphosphatase
MRVNSYVVGFLFDKQGNVVLIRKNRPDWQKGRLNGVGGHIEPGETPEAAMVREFREEAGATVTWRYFCRVYGDGYEVFYFSSHDTADIRTMTDEEVGSYPLNNLPENILPNLKWLLPMAAYPLVITAEVHHSSPVC